MSRRLVQRDSEVIDRQQPVSFSWCGRTLQGFTGDSLASALLANGIKTVARSYKYSRHRGLLCSHAEEPNALVNLEREPFLIPNARATQVELYQDLYATSPTAAETPANRFKRLFMPFNHFMPAGFYYKTFKYPTKWWPHYETLLRSMAGISPAPRQTDQECYDHMYQHCDVLVIGAGVAGLQAALAAARSCAQVLIVDERPQTGGLLYEYADQTLDGKPALQWLQHIQSVLDQMTNVHILRRTTAFAFHDFNLVNALELLQDHLPLEQRSTTFPRQRLHKIRARQVILATGAHERPMAFHNNDLPGVMLASAVLSWVNRYAVSPGDNTIVFCNNDSGLDVAVTLKMAGLHLQAVVDCRPEIADTYTQALHGVPLFSGHAVQSASGDRALQSVSIAPIRQLQGQWQVDAAATQTLACDVLAVAGGWNPVVHLDCHTGSKPYWDEQQLAFMPAIDKPDRFAAGALNGFSRMDHCRQDGAWAGAQAVRALGLEAATVKSPESQSLHTAALFMVPPLNTGHNKLFVDMQNDVTANDIALAIRENYRCIEHVKRYTGLGFGTDQGKTGNVLGVAIAAQFQGLSMSEVGTTTFRPAYTPVTFGALVGENRRDLFDPKRYTPQHFAHLELAAKWETVGQWMRPHYYPQAGEDLDAAVHRECLAARTGLAVMDASTLGKIDIQGPDAREFLNRVYTNAWSKLAPGCCRYGLMLDENGMVLDDGVTACIGENHFLMTTTTGGAARVYLWLERWLQTEWPALNVYLTSVTDHWSTTAVVGPKSRALLQQLCSDCDFSNKAFPFMHWRPGTVAGIPARIMRISFSGELAFEINVQANYGRYIWEQVMTEGADNQITPYGTETMHVLRAEKGFVIVGQDTDGSVTPVDASMQWILSRKKTFPWLGKRSLARSDMLREDRKQLVGLLTTDPQQSLTEGAQLVNEPESKEMQGHVTSSYQSPILQRSIALALVKGGRARMGEKIYARTAHGMTLEASITGSVFYDPEGERRDG